MFLIKLLTINISSGGSSIEKIVEPSSGFIFRDKLFVLHTLGSNQEFLSWSPRIFSFLLYVGQILYKGTMIVKKVLFF